MRYANVELCRNIKYLLSQFILPKLESSESQAAASAINIAIDEMIKRDTSTRKILAVLLPEGVSIAGDLAQCLSRTGIAKVEADYQQIAAMEDNADVDMQLLAEKYQALSDFLEVGCRRLFENYDQLKPEQKHQADTLIEQAGQWDNSYIQQQSRPLEYQECNAVSVDMPLTPEKLKEFLIGQLGTEQDIQIRNFERIEGGMSKQTYFLTLDRGSKSEDLVVRKAKNPEFFDFGCLMIKREYYLLKDVYDTGFPCPQPLWFAESPVDMDGSYFVMTKSRGKLLGNFFGSANRLPEDVLMHLAEIFAQLHAIPMEHFAKNIGLYYDERYLNCTVEQALRYNLESFMDLCKRLDRLRTPMEVRCFHWLQKNIPKNPNKAVLTHNDLLIHNFLTDGGKVSAVLDWEGANFGDPAADLGYVKSEISKHVDWKKFLNHYYAHGGQPIDESSFGYHECMNQLRNLVGTNRNTVSIKSGNAYSKDIMLEYNYIPVFAEIIDKNIKASRFGG